MEWLLSIQQDLLRPIFSFIGEHPYWGGLIFILLNSAIVFGIIPGWVLMLAGGYLFGPILGSVYAFLGLTCGCSLAFFLGRHILQNWVRKRYGSKLARLDKAVQRYGLSIVFMTRLSPLFPFNLLNYGYGLTRIKYHHYLLGGLGMLPSIIIQVYVGSLAKSLYDIESKSMLTPSPIVEGSQILMLAFTLVAIIYLTFIARKMMKDIDPPKTDG